MSKSCSCKFLCGIDTDMEQYEGIRTALEMQSDFKSEMLFYKKNGRYSYQIFLISVKAGC